MLLHLLPHRWQDGPGFSDNPINVVQGQLDILAALRDGSFEDIYRDILRSFGSRSGKEHLQYGPQLIFISPLEFHTLESSSGIGDPGDRLSEKDMDSLLMALDRVHAAAPSCGVMVVLKLLGDVLSRYTPSRQFENRPHDVFNYPVRAFLWAPL